MHVPWDTPVAVQGSQHHVGGVQGVDEVGWEAILLLQSVGLPVNPEALGLAPSWPVSLPAPPLPSSPLPASGTH